MVRKLIYLIVLTFFNKSDISRMLELVCRTIKPTRIKGYFGKHYVFD